MNIIPIKRALLSVSDKTGIVEFAQGLAARGIALISTGGTSQLLQKANIPHQQVEEITDLPEMLGGRVKTLHPRIHGGILGKRDEHETEAQQHGIEWIDLVVVNFYPFEHATTQKTLTWDEAIEYVDIGGPTMVRAAAKNMNWVSVVTDPLDYPLLLDLLEKEKGIDSETRKKWAMKAFALTANYDAMIHRYFTSSLSSSNEMPDELTLTLSKKMTLRYGENPHQQACAYQFTQEQQGVLAAKQHQGKPLSYNNLIDAEAAWSAVREFEQPACVIVKHANPCGVSTALTLKEAYDNAYHADAQSAFGGIVALNGVCTEEIALTLSQIFTEVILASDYTQAALTIFQTKPNLRVLQMPMARNEKWERKFITGGMLWQEKDNHQLLATHLEIVTSLKPSIEEIEAMLFAWRALKHIKSNGIVIAKEATTLGIGAGQVSRIDAVDIAITKAGINAKGAVAASDGFFPFRDGIDKLAAAGIENVIQPGGSIKDQEVIDACNEHKLAMVFTNTRCFRH